MLGEALKVVNSYKIYKRQSGYLIFLWIILLSVNIFLKISNQRINLRPSVYKRSVMWSYLRSVANVSFFMTIHEQNPYYFHFFNLNLLSVFSQSMFWITLRFGCFWLSLVEYGFICIPHCIISVSLPYLRL